MLTIYRRHIKKCEHRNEGRKYRRCRCPIWVDGFLGGEDIRQAVRERHNPMRRETVRDWEKAQEIVREWEAEGEMNHKPQNDPLTVQQACDKFVADAEARNLREATIYKFHLLFKQLKGFADDRGIRYLKEFTVELWHEFRATWPNKNVAALKKLGCLRTFLRFCHDNAWISENCGRKLGNPRITLRPTMPFTQDEMIKILTAAKPGSRIRALVLLLRYSGLRIGDATTLDEDRLNGGNLLLYTAKTGVPVFCPLPDFVVATLQALPKRGKYFFWTGNSKRKSLASYWQRQLKRLFERAGVVKGHAHRFRDTFAVELLLAGTEIERVAALLGHTNIKTTQKHYAPWTLSRQEQLEGDVKRAWLADPIALAEGKIASNRSGRRSKASRSQRLCRDEGYAKGTRERQARQAQQSKDRKPGSGGEDRTPDLGIMRPSLYH